MLGLVSFVMVIMLLMSQQHQFVEGMECGIDIELPALLGEVASCAIGPYLITLGEGDKNTWVFNSITQTWQKGAQRMSTGNHHAAVVYEDKCYILGGLGGGAGDVQVYDPFEDIWTEAPSIPISTGSASAAVIDDFIYYCGGIQGSITIDSCVRLNLQSLSWETIQSMPEGINHAASCTDGSILYVFGGRKGGNFVGKGYDYVQLYDPATNTWQLLTVKLPEARGGMGSCVCLDGSCYIFGGETTQTDRPFLSTRKTYTRIDQFNISSKQFSVPGLLPIGMHGIFPVFYDDKIHIAGGGDKVANSQTKIHLSCTV
eukprot:TRINITY_DN297_c0_g1_i1.p1 TRINITY_DN297_c0_g1~~TRINITY_DN297_c0_g1_i1.p1  ORF type:complete len:315 (-),score=42.47 TRINITY_DN297_c0_g1_i1:276-1220(-)